MTVDISKLRSGDIVTATLEFNSTHAGNVFLRPVGEPYGSTIILKPDALRSSSLTHKWGDVVIDPRDGEGTIVFIDMARDRVVLSYPHQGPRIFCNHELTRPEPVELEEAA